jgi:hypothetical protein
VPTCARVTVLLALPLSACGADPEAGPDGPDGAVSGRDASTVDGSAADASVDAGTADADVPDDAGRPDAQDPLAALSDSFDGAALDPAWSVLNPDLVELAVGGGELRLRILQHALWFQDEEGVLVHRAVTGDFRLTATVRARRATEPALPADRFVHLGGLMARDPSRALENYVFVVVGFDETDLSVETKTTVDGQSTYEGPAWPSGDAELRLCRVGSTFIAAKRAPGAGAWVEAARWQRPDLPASLTVGANAYAFAVDRPGAPDLVASFDRLEFSSIASAADCVR